MENTHSNGGSALKMSFNGSPFLPAPIHQRGNDLRLVGACEVNEILGSPDRRILRSRSLSN